MAIIYQHKEVGREPLVHEDVVLLTVVQVCPKAGIIAKHLGLQEASLCVLGDWLQNESVLR